MNNKNNDLEILNLSIVLSDGKMGVICKANKKVFIDVDLFQKHLVNFTDELHAMLVKDDFIKIENSYGS